MAQEIPIPTIVDDLEYFISSLPNSDEEKNSLRGTTTNIITNFHNNNHKRNKVNRMSREYQDTGRFSKTTSRNDRIPGTPGNTRKLFYAAHLAETKISTRNTRKTFILVELELVRPDFIQSHPEDTTPTKKENNEEKKPKKGTQEERNRKPPTRKKPSTKKETNEER
ncbi:hypothetical protein JTB14_002587 [Gonioctena quinquepunctata]|nr:hypothetical protein JTB14_002587 [Gonioctena quinquepunctata]